MGKYYEKMSEYSGAFEGYFKSQLRAADKFVIFLFMLKGTV